MKLKVPSPGKPASGSISCLRSSARRWRSSSGRSSSRLSSSTAPRANDLPITAAASTTARSAGSSRSSRAASSAWMVGGTETADGLRGPRQTRLVSAQLTLVHQHPHQLLDEQGVSLGGGEDPAGTRRRPRPRRRPGARRARGSRRRSTAPAQLWWRRRRPRAKSGLSVEQLGAGDGDDQDRDAPDRAREAARSARGRWARPSGRPRR